MKPLLILIALAAGLAQQPGQTSPEAVSEKVWKSATDLPNVDMAGLTPTRNAVLKLLRKKPARADAG